MTPTFMKEYTSKNTYISLLDERFILLKMSKRINELLAFCQEPVFKLNSQSSARIKEMKMKLITEIYNYSLCILMISKTSNKNSYEKFKETVANRTVAHREELINNEFIPYYMKKRLFDHLDYVDGFLEEIS